MRIDLFIFNFIFCYLFLNGLMIIIKKYSLIQKLELYSMKIKSKFLYGVSHCEFCLEHHLLIIPLIICATMNYFEPIQVFIPFLVSSFSQLIKQYKNNEKN